jgi:hypothetical protein
MLKILLLFLQPAQTWERIGMVANGYFYMVFIRLLPMTAFGAGVEAWGLFRWGKVQARFGSTRTFTETSAIHFGIFQAALLIGVVFFSALLTHLAAESFHGRRRFIQVFTLMTYGCGPLLLMQALNAIPMLNPAIPWALGFTLSAWIIYPGITSVLKTDSTHAVGVYLCALFIVMLISGLATLLAGMYLLGYFNTQHSWLARHLQQWLQ